MLHYHQKVQWRTFSKNQFSLVDYMHWIYQPSILLRPGFERHSYKHPNFRDIGTLKHKIITTLTYEIPIGTSMWHERVYQPFTTMHLAVLHSAPLWIYFALKACLNDPSANESGKILTSISSVSHAFVLALKSCLIAFFVRFLFKPNGTKTNIRHRYRYYIIIRLLVYMAIK